MTIELQEHLQREMEDALSLADPDRKRDAIRTVLTHQTNALIDCQRKTAERVKTIVAELPAMREDIKDIKAVIEAGRRTFRKVAFTALKWIAVGGGGAEFVRYLLSSQAS